MPPTVLVEPGTHREPLLTSEYVAELLNVTPKTVRQLALRGEIRFLRVGRSYRFRDAWVQDFIERTGRTNRRR